MIFSLEVSLHDYKIGVWCGVIHIQETTKLNGMTACRVGLAQWRHLGRGESREV